jgi:hypothetical protein
LRPYDLFRTPDRARAEELGDVLAEGIFWLLGRAAIGEYYADVCGRDMTHKIERLVVGDGGAAFVQACQYPSGARVTCAAVLDLKDGLITRLSGVQAWDE